MTVLMLFLTRKMPKEKFLFYVNVYSNVKSVVTIVLITVTLFMFGNRANVSKAVFYIEVFLCYFCVVTVDSYLIFRRIKRIRLLEMTTKEYFIKYAKNVLISIICYLVLGQIGHVLMNADDCVFIGCYLLIMWLFQFITPYFLKITCDASSTEVVEIKEKLMNTCQVKSKYRLYSYEGEKSKSANAFVVGTSINWHIFISDYYISNASQEEVLALLCHECGHIKKHDIEKRMLFINVAIAGVFFVANLLDCVEVGPLLSITSLLMYALVMVLIYKRIQQKQELEADRFAVSMIQDENVFINALNRLYALNDMMRKNGRFWAALSTHPQLQRRINNVSN